MKLSKEQLALAEALIEEKRARTEAWIKCINNWLSKERPKWKSC